MSVPEIDWIWVCPKNGQKPNPKQPKHFLCDCCGAVLGAVVITDKEGKTWGTDCFSRARGHAKSSKKAIDLMKVLGWVAENFPEVGGEVRYDRDGKDYVVTERNWAIIRDIPHFWVKLQNKRTGKFLTLEPRNIMSDLDWFWPGHPHRA